MYCWFSRISVTLSNMACSRPYHLFVSIHHADTITYKVVHLSFPIAFRVLFLKKKYLEWFNLLAHPGACVVL